MKHTGKKGQGAMEYLMTYGWAILVVMIVGVVLWQLGVFKVGQTSTTTTGWAKLSPLSSSIVYASATQNFSAQFNNLNGVPIRVKSVVCTESVTTAQCAIYVDDNAAAAIDGVLAAEVTTGAGNTFKLNCICDGATGPSVTDANKNPQDTYAMTIVLTYDSVLGATRTEHIETGQISGPAE